MAEQQEGIIVKGIGGFYTVEAADAVYTCRARGIFRKNGQTPLAGDHVRIQVLDAGEGALEEILPRKNHLVRPPVANLDVLVLVASIADPETNTLIMDKMIARAEDLGIEPVLVINKIDTVEKEELLSVMQVYGAAHDFAAIVPISAKRNEGVDELLGLLAQFLPEGPQLFPEDMVTDQPERQVCAEIIREKLLLCLDKEIPHGTAVEITTFSERDDGIIDLDATIYCEKASHKGIIIGKGGAMLKKISTLARTDIEAFMGTKVFLQTWVKVKENWRDNMNLIKNFGYRDE